MRRVSRRMSVALGASPRPEASPNTALSPLRTAEPGALSAVESAAEGDDEEDQREEMLARVAELEELLEESETKLETAASIGQQMVTRLQYLDEENEELRAAAGAGVGGALGVTSAQHAALEADFAAAQAELEQRTDELAEAQGQQAWLESQATGAEKAQLQGVIDDQAVALQEKGEVIASLERELAAGKGRERTHEEALAQLEEVVGGLRRQVSRAEVVQVRLVRDKQLADAMRFATETKVEALEEKLATAETVIDHAKRRDAVPSGGEPEASALRKNVSRLEAELSKQTDALRDSASKAEAAAAENLELRTRMRAYEAIQLASTTVQGSSDDVDSNGGLGMSLADDLVIGGADEAGEMHAKNSLIHYLQQECIAMARDRDVLATELSRVHDLIEKQKARAAAGDGEEGESGAGRVLVKKTGSLLKRNPAGLFGVHQWKRRYFNLEGCRLRYFDRTSDAHPKGELDLYNYELHASKGVTKRLGKLFSFELSWCGGAETTKQPLHDAGAGGGGGVGASGRERVRTAGEERGDFCLAAENADEFTSWLELLHRAMSMPRLEPEPEDEEREQQQPADTAVEHSAEQGDDGGGGGAAEATVATAVPVDAMEEAVTSAAVTSAGAGAADVTSPKIAAIDTAAAAIKEDQQQEEGVGAMAGVSAVDVEVSVESLALAEEIIAQGTSDGLPISELPSDVTIVAPPAVPQASAEKAAAGLGPWDAFWGDRPVTLSVDADGLAVHAAKDEQMAVEKEGGEDDGAVNGSDTVTTTELVRFSYVQLQSWNVLGTQGIRLCAYLEQEQQHKIAGGGGSSEVAATAAVAAAAAEETAGVREQEGAGDQDQHVHEHEFRTADGASVGEALRRMTHGGGATSAT